MNLQLRGLCRLVLLVVAMLVASSAAGAQQTDGSTSEPTTTGSAATQAEVDRLLSLLDDPQVREALREALLRQVAAESDVPVTDPLAEQQERFRAIFDAWDTLGSELSRIWSESLSGGTQGEIGYALLLALIGGVGSYFVARFLRGVRDRSRPEPTATRTSRLFAALGLLFVDLAIPLTWIVLLNLASFVLPASLTTADAIVAVVIRAGLWVIGIFIAVDVLWSPKRPEAGLLKPHPQRAPMIGKTVIGVTAAIMVIASISRLLIIKGMQTGPAALFGLLLSVALLLVLIALIWRARSRVHAAIVEAMPPGGAVARLAVLWPIPVSLYLLLIWFATLESLFAGQAEAAGRLVLSIVLPIFVFSLASGFSRRVLLHAPPVEEEPEQGDEEAAPGAQKPTKAKQKFTATSKVVLAIWFLAIALVFVLLARLYHLDLATLIGLKPDFFGAVSQVVSVLLVAYLAYAILAAAIERSMVEIDEGKNPSRAKRLRTLLPLARVFLLVVVVVMAVLVSLSALGVDIGPLIAGAGIFGLAIGLGTQKLVTDIVAGIFFLLDDAFAVGDYVEIGNLRGRVESLSIRSMKLRHHRGAVHTVPYGEMNALTNHSRDWVIVKLEFRLPTDTDLALVKKIVKKVGQEIAEDPSVGKFLLEPLKSQGVRRFEDNAIIVGVKFMSVPGEQFVIRRMVFQKIRDAFDAADIHFADRGVVVHVGGESKEEEAIAGAAAAAVQHPGGPAKQ